MDLEKMVGGTDGTPKFAAGFEIRGRYYIAESSSDTDALFVVGEVKGKGGALLPGLLDALVEKLRGLGYPANALPEYCEVQDDQVMFVPDAGRVYEWVRQAFAADVRLDPRHAEIVNQGRVLVRQESLAKKVGLVTDQKAYHAARRAILLEWEALCAELWAGWEHPWKATCNLTGGKLLGEGFWQEHEWARGKATLADLYWLKHLSEDVEMKIESLEVED